jgi:hypothetical protein
LVGHWDEAHEVTTGLDVDFEIGVPTEGDFTSWSLDVMSMAGWTESPSQEWTILAAVYFTVAVFKGDFLGALDSDTDDFELLGEINNHYFEIGVERELEIVARVDTSSHADVPVEPLRAKVLHQLPPSAPKPLRPRRHPHRPA